MKKHVLFFSLFTITYFSNAQNGQKWSEDGNLISQNSFLGTINNFPLSFRVNNTEWFRISPLGQYTFTSLSGTGNGLIYLDNTGTLSRMNFTGNTNHVLLGNGTFNNISNLTGWFTQPGLVYTNGKVGINGLSNPNEALEVNGNGIFNGNISAEQVLVGDVVSSGKSLRINTSLCMKGFDPNVQGSRSELCAMGNDFYIQSTNGLNNHTIINHSNLGNVGIGTSNPTEKLEVNGNLKIMGKIVSDRIETSRISSTDSILFIGDSTLVFSSVNTIYPDYYNWTNNTIVKGVALGHPGGRGYGEFAVGLGRGVAYGNSSLAIGTYVRTAVGATNSIVLGSGYGGIPLINSTPHSLMIGFNSNLPTIFVESALAGNQTGRVGISTTSPEEKFQVLDGFKKFTVGDASYAGLGFGTSYIGFNASRQSGGWQTSGDGANNGGAVIYGTINGRMYLAPLSTNGTTNQTNVSDAQLLENAMVIFPNGAVGIQTECIPAGFSLAVDGKIICEEVTVKLSDGSGCWPDYVFNSDYKLMPLNELENYVALNKHLPEIPSEKEILEKGVNTSEMNISLLKKIEEMTLYMIEMNKKIEALQKENENLKNK